LVCPLLDRMNSIMHLNVQCSVHTRGDCFVALEESDLLNQRFKKLPVLHVPIVLCHQGWLRHKHLAAATSGRPHVHLAHGLSPVSRQRLN